MGVDLPFDLKSGEMLQNVWNRWLLWDPVRMVEKYYMNLRNLKLIYIDCGTKDEFNLHWGCSDTSFQTPKNGYQTFLPSSQMDILI